VGPVYSNGQEGEEQLLKKCYLNSLNQAVEKGARSVAFPSISTGVYGYPVGDAAKVAAKTVVEFVNENPDSIDKVIFCAFDEGNRKALESALSEVTSA
jgi:O-acetyl-ADP-ribose deacetylase (regulator of RNase III)